jgi:hypothetical protein
MEEDTIFGEQGSEHVAKVVAVHTCRHQLCAASVHERGIVSGDAFVYNAGVC